MAATEKSAIEGGEIGGGAIVAKSANDSGEIGGGAINRLSQPNANPP